MYLILPNSPNKTQLTSSSAKIRNSLFCFLKIPFNRALSKGILLLCVGILYSRAKFKLRRCHVRNFLMILNFKDLEDLHNHRPQLGNFIDSISH